MSWLRPLLKILLIEPPDFSKERNFMAADIAAESFCPPLGLIVLGSYLKAEIPETELHILDGQILNLDEIIGKLKEIKPAITGINVYHRNYDAVLRIAEFAKSLDSQVLVGGHFATGFASNILLNRGPFSRHYCVDGIIQQDGEVGFCEYAGGYPVASVKNLIYQKEEGGIKVNMV